MKFPSLFFKGLAMSRVYLHDHGAFSSGCGERCGWYIAGKIDPDGMRLRNPCDHGRYEEHVEYPCPHPQAHHPTIQAVDDCRDDNRISCPGGEFLPEDALLIEKAAVHPYPGRNSSMIDREALAAALERRDEWLRRPETVPMYSVVIEAAARERLAQLAATCEVCGGTGLDIARPAPHGVVRDCLTCHGRGTVYPPALVERIALVAHCARWRAVAILDALNDQEVEDAK